MEHDQIIISDEDEMVTRQNLFYSDFKVEYLGRFIEVSYVFSPMMPMNYISATYKI